MELNQKHNFAQQLVIVLLLISLFKGLLFALITPMWQAPDEPTHAAYIETIVTQHRLPTPKDEISSNLNRSFDRTNFWPEIGRTVGIQGPTRLTISAAAHPPLYYLLSAPIYYLSTPLGLKWQIFFLRLLGVLASTVVVWLGFKSAELVFPKSTFIKILVPTLIVFHPQFSYIMTSANNDALANLLFAAAFYELLVIIIKGLTPSRAAVTGLTLGLGLSTKASFIAMLPLAGLAFVVSLALRRDYLDFAKNSAVSIGALIVSAGWLLLAPSKYFWHVTGAVQTGFQGWGRVLSPSFLKVYFVDQIAPQFWGDFGWLSIPMSQTIYNLLLIFVGLAILGLIIGGYRIARGNEVLTKESLLSVGFLLVSIGVFALALLRFGLLGAGEAQGRYLFPALVPISIVIFAGLRSLFVQSIRCFVTPLVFIGLAFLNLVAVFGYILPYYYFGGI